jgi:riboflavin synthase
VIPTTWASTTLGGRRVGERVNLEADLLAKYTEQLLRPAATAATETTLSSTWLAEHGWG